MCPIKLRDGHLLLISSYLCETATLSLFSAIHAIRSFITYNVPSPFLYRTPPICKRTSSLLVVILLGYGSSFRNRFDFDFVVAVDRVQFDF